MWSKGVFSGGQLFKLRNNDLITRVNLPKLTKHLLKYFIKRLETKYITWNRITKYVINYVLANYISISDNITLLYTSVLLRLILIKSYKGRAFILNKPMNGQRTWSNARGIKYTAVTYKKLLKLNNWI